MGREQLKPYLDWFEAHIAACRAEIGGDDAPMRLKREHSLKVLGNAERIAGSLETAGLLSSRLAHLARLAALLHDTGRFPQFVRYRTFNDAASEDHGRLGVRSLKAGTVLDDLDPDSRRLVLGAVTLHNRRSVPHAVPADVATLAFIVRDADKLDIFRVMVSHLHPDSAYDPIVALHLNDHPDNYTEAMYQSVLTGILGAYGEMVWLNDFKLLLLSWVYDLNYMASIQMLQETGYVEALLGYLPRTDRMLRLGKRIRSDMQAALSGQDGRITPRDGVRTGTDQLSPLPKAQSVT